MAGVAIGAHQVTGSVGAYQTIPSAVNTSSAIAVGSTDTSVASASMAITSSAIAVGSTDTSATSASEAISSSATIEGSTDTSAATAQHVVAGVSSSNGAAAGSTNTSAASAAQAITSSAIAAGSTDASVASAPLVFPVSATVTGTTSASAASAAEAFLTSAAVDGSTTIAAAAAALAITANGIATGSTSTAAGAHVGPIPVSVAAVENAMRVAAYAWAGTNSLTFNFDNSTGLDVTNPTQPMLVWAFSETGRERISGDLVTITGECRGTILTPATPIAPGAAPYVTSPMSDSLTLAESLLEAFRGNEYSEALVMEHSMVSIDGAVGTMQAVTAVVEWELIIEHKLLGSNLSLTTPSGVEQSYELFRSIWSTEVEPTITTGTYFDVPPGLEISLPAAVCSHAILRGSSVEIGSSLGLGRVDINLHYLLGTGVQDMQVDTDLIVQAFDSVSSGKVVYQTPRVTRLGRTSEETWQVNVRLPFTFKDTFS